MRKYIHLGVGFGYNKYIGVALGQVSLSRRGILVYADMGMGYPTTAELSCYGWGVSFKFPVSNGHEKRFVWHTGKSSNE